MAATSAGAGAADQCRNPGDRVLVEAPTYLGALQAFDAYQAQYTSVPTDHDGVLTGKGGLAAALCGGVKFMYLLPIFKTPPA